MPPAHVQFEIPPASWAPESLYQSLPVLWRRRRPSAPPRPPELSLEAEDPNDQRAIVREEASKHACCGCVTLSDAGQPSSGISSGPPAPRSGMSQKAGIAAL